MSWFRKKGNYWYFVKRVKGKEIQHYIGDDEAVKRKLLPKTKSHDHKKKARRSKPSRRD